MAKESVYELFGYDPSDPTTRGFSIKRTPRAYADDYYNVEWALGMIREYNRQTHRGEFIPTAYPTPPYRGRARGYLADVHRRAGKAGSAARRRMRRAQ
jgi:hypothetical protein